MALQFTLEASSKINNIGFAFDAAYAVIDSARFGVKNPITHAVEDVILVTVWANAVAKDANRNPVGGVSIAVPHGQLTSTAQSYVYLATLTDKFPGAVTVA